MRNIIDYVVEEQRSLTEVPFGPVDSLVFSKLAYLNFDEFDLRTETKNPMPVRELLNAPNAIQLCENMPDGKNSRRLLNALSNSARFRDAGMAFYVNHIDDVAENSFWRQPSCCQRIWLTWPFAEQTPHLSAGRKI